MIAFWCSHLAAGERLQQASWWRASFIGAWLPEDAFSEKMAFGSLNAGRRGNVTHITFKYVHVREKSFNIFFLLFETE